MGNTLIDDYGQSVALIVFGGGVITLLGHLLGYVCGDVIQVADTTAATAGFAKFREVAQLLGVLH